MSSWVDLEDRWIELADEIGKRLKLNRESVVEQALVALAVRLNLPVIPEDD